MDPTVLTMFSLKRVRWYSSMMSTCPRTPSPIPAHAHALKQLAVLLLLLLLLVHDEHLPPPPGPPARPPNRYAGCKQAAGKQHRRRAALVRDERLPPTPAAAESTGFFGSRSAPRIKTVGRAALAAAAAAAS